jgi:starch synthase (maltosyl-transferring)
MIGRIPITDVEPAVGCGRWPAKAVVGETFTVSATVFREGHDAVNANVVLKGPKNRRGPWTPMHPVGAGLDRWAADVTPDAEGAWTFAIEAWSDPVETWRHAAEIKVPAGIDVELMLEEGAQLLERAAQAAPRNGGGGGILRDAVHALRDTRRPPQARLAAALAPNVRAVLDRYPLRELVTTSDPLPVRVERVRALYGSWYEFFPRSEGASLDPPRSGTLQAAMQRLPAIAAMGFDVVYLPPVHPIGSTFRKGANNTLDPAPGDPGVPWAIGSDEGGHDAIHPDLGTIDDFDKFVARTRELGMEVALDYALQASPDHPWVKEHPDWFSVRVDGSIAYAENPPKKYQDIYPLNFDRDRDGIYREMLRVLRYWISHGVRIFRVDNPHTKPVEFWEWLIGEVNRTDPDVIFLAEAFTRPAMMRMLGRIGFQQSYTYFTWRNSKWELEEYLRELAGETAAIMRPNFFVNTPDILHAYLQYGGPPAFKVRAVLASMLSPTWGVYSGYELFEHVALRPGSEEYLYSEKYQYRPRDWAAYEPGGPREGQSLAPFIARLNEIRRSHPALQWLRNLEFHRSWNDNIMCFSKSRRVGDGADRVIVVVNLNPHGTEEGTVGLQMPSLGLDWHDGLTVRDELTGAQFNWGEYNYVRLDPWHEPAHILTVVSDTA